MIEGEHLDTGGGDGCKRWGVACRTTGCVQPYSVELGPHGYRREDDPRDDATAMRAALRKWNTRRNPGVNLGHSIVANRTPVDSAGDSPKSPAC